MVVNDSPPGHIDLPCGSHLDKAILFSDLLTRYVAGHYNVRWDETIPDGRLHQDDFNLRYGPLVDFILVIEARGFKHFMEYSLNTAGYTENKFNSIVSWLREDFQMNFKRRDCEFTFLCTYVSIVGVYFHEIGNVPEASFWMTRSVEQIAMLYQRSGVLAAAVRNRPRPPMSIRERSMAVAALLQQLEAM